VLVVLLLFPGAASSGAAGLRQADNPQPGVPGAVETPAASVPPAEQPDAAAGTHTVRLPLIYLNYAPPISYRLGFSGGEGVVGKYPEVSTLKTGWYIGYWASAQPPRPGGIEYAQMVNVHQNIKCTLWSVNAWDRSKCPYTSPHSYSFWPSGAEITQAAAANPGSLWLIGNEMDRRDWSIRDGSGKVVGTGGQNEMLPELYATAYHDLYTLIKGADPKARIAIGAVIQATPLRLEYLTKVWDAYQMQFGTPMPVDVWNVHNFILKENINDNGASIPPGSSASTGSYLGNDSLHVSMAIFDEQIRAFRTWMKERGQQDKPLIVSEYGVLYSHIPEVDSAQKVQDFMIATFDYFLNTQDCTLGYAADNCRLVQRWSWYSFNDNGQSNGFNPYVNLFDPVTLQLTSTGARFRDYSLRNLPTLSR
jgi:hypothetical protein